MNENVKRFLEEASKDEAFTERLKKATTPEDVISLAKEKGISLTTEDLEAKDVSDYEISDDELDAVSGGDACGCFAGGLGKKKKFKLKDNVVEYDNSCTCPIFGVGNYSAYEGCDCIGSGSGAGAIVRCACVLAGGGKTLENDEEAKKKRDPLGLKRLLSDQFLKEPAFIFIASASCFKAHIAVEYMMQNILFGAEVSETECHTVVRKSIGDVSCL